MGSRPTSRLRSALHTHTHTHWRSRRRRLMAVENRRCRPPSGVIPQHWSRSGRRLVPARVDAARSFRTTCVRGLRPAHPAVQEVLQTPPSRPRLARCRAVGVSIDGRNRGSVVSIHARTESSARSPTRRAGKVSPAGEVRVKRPCQASCSRGTAGGSRISHNGTRHPDCGSAS
jgi:hypothetical protein